MKNKRNDKDISKKEKSIEEKSFENMKKEEKKS